MMGKKTFDQIASEQGWDMHSCANVLRDFTNLIPEMLDHYAQTRADEENGTSDAERIADAVLDQVDVDEWNAVVGDATEVRNSIIEQIALSRA